MAITDLGKLSPETKRALIEALQQVPPLDPFMSDLYCHGRAYERDGEHIPIDLVEINGVYAPRKP